MKLSWLNPLNWLRKNRTPKPTLNYSGYAAILLNPVYEPTTRLMAEWCDSLTVPRGFGKVIIVSGESAKKAVVEDALINTRGMKRVKIFCGHGIDKALLGPPQKGELVIRVGDEDHSILYDDSLTEAGSAALFAFCCSAGRELGKKFASFKSHTFLGFRDEVPIETENSECFNAFQDVFAVVATAILEAGEILPQHEISLRNLYHEKYLYFFQGIGKRNKRARYMWLALTEHRRLICRYGGPP